MGTFLLSLLGITVLATLPLPQVSSPQGTVKGCFRMNERECERREGNKGPFTGMYPTILSLVLFKVLMWLMI